MAITTSSNKGCTIAEAADSLRVPKKTIRHMLGRPDRKARLLREYRNSKKGLVTIEIIPKDLLDDLAAATAGIPSSSQSNPGPAGAADPEPVKDNEFDPAIAVASEMVQSDLSVPTSTRPADAVLIVATYERLLAEKEGRLTDLRSALEAERENSRRLSEALAREQANHAALNERVTPPPAEPAPAPRSWLSRLLGR